MFYTKGARWVTLSGGCGLQERVGPSPQKPIVDLSDVRGNAAARPLSVEAAEFSPALGPQTRETAGTVALSSEAGTIAPVDFAGISVPAVAGMKFLGCC